MSWIKFEEGLEILNNHLKNNAIKFVKAVDQEKAMENLVNFVEYETLGPERWQYGGSHQR